MIASASGDAKGGARWLDSAQMVEASSVVLRDGAGPLGLSGLLIGRHRLSPVLGVHKNERPCLVIAFALGLFAAWKTMGTTSRVKGLLDSVFTIPYGAAAHGLRLFCSSCCLAARPGWASG